jgi:hypothetical protein
MQRVGEQQCRSSTQVAPGGRQSAGLKQAPLRHIFEQHWPSFWQPAAKPRQVTGERPQVSRLQEPPQQSSLWLHRLPSG